jgi:hypothetical protein
MRRAATLVSLFLACGVAQGLAPDARADDVPISAEARNHFAAGVALLQDPKAPRYEEAYLEFKAAYAASPSYKILGNLGLCAMKIERDEEAIAAYETYLKEAGAELDAPGREQIERDLLTLKSGLVRLTVSAQPAGVMLIDVRTPVQGADIRNVYGPLTAETTLGVRRGHHTITAKLAGYLDQTWEFDASDQAPPPHAFVMVKPLVAVPRTVRERPIPTAAWVTGGVAGVLAIGGAVTGALALVEHQQYKDDNTGNNVSAAQSDRRTGLALNAVTDGLLAGAIVGAALTVYFVVSRPTVERSVGTGTPLQALVPARLTPLCGASLGRGAAAGETFGASADWVF